MVDRPEDLKLGTALAHILSFTYPPILRLRF